MIQKIKPKPILHIIARDLRMEEHIKNELKKERHRNSTFLQDYYVILSYKGECKIEVFNGEIETLEMEDGYKPDEECIDKLIEPNRFDRILNKIAKLLRLI